jgi:hypothetical protein
MTVRFEQGIPTELSGVIREKSLGQGRYKNSTGPGCPWLLLRMTPYSCNTLFMGPLPSTIFETRKKTPGEEGGAKVPRYSFLLTPFMKPICLLGVDGIKVT